MALLAFISVGILECSARSFNPNLKEYYVSVKPSSGSGTSWNDAMDIDFLIEKLPNVDHHCTVYFEAGRYHLENLLVDSVIFKNGLTLLGGYSVMNHAAPSSPLGKTIFMMGESQWVVSMNDSDSLVFRNMQFEGPGKNQNVSSCITVATRDAIESPNQKTAAISFDKCSFLNRCGLDINFCHGDVTNCDFYFDATNCLRLSGCWPNEKVRVESCSFSGKKSIRSTALYANLFISNCTFGGEDGKPVATSLIYARTEDSTSVLQVWHNTILGRVYSNRYNSSIKGNIIYGSLTNNSPSSDYYADDTYNLFLGNNEDMVYGDTYIADSLVSNVFPYKDSSFTFEAQENAYTRCIPLKRDFFYLDNMREGSLRCRYPIVTQDQLGNKRYEYPCYGAYEYSFPVLDNYYVKENGDDNGDGSDWKHAMNLKTFNYFLPYAPYGCKIHISEGVYTPFNDKTGWNNMYHGACFRVHNPLTIIGGYSKNPSKYEKPDPVLNPTIFSGDIDYNDSIPGMIIGSNSYSILVFTPRRKGTLDVSGICFQGAQNPEKFNSQGAVSFDVYGKMDSCEVALKKCKFQYNTQAVYIYDCNLSVMDCIFDNIFNTAISYVANTEYVKVESCSFSNCQIGVSSYAKDVRLTNSTFTYNNCDISMSIGQKGTCKIMNNTIMDIVNIWGDTLRNLYFYGNLTNDSIILGSKNYTMHSRCNLLFSDKPDKKVDWLSSSDKIVDYEDLLPAIQKESDSVYNVEYVEFSEDGDISFTPTLTLLCDKLEDGTSLRFPRDSTGVREDQRHASRMKKTCYGAFELHGKYAPTFIPTAFTPYSQNGKNDVFMRNSEVYIYNRYGQVICHSEAGWDGRCRGELVEPGVYFYAVMGEYEVYKGTIEVIKSK